MVVTVGSAGYDYTSVRDAVAGVILGDGKVLSQDYDIVVYTDTTEVGSIPLCWYDANNFRIRILGNAWESTHWKSRPMLKITHNCGDNGHPGWPGVSMRSAFYCKKVTNPGGIYIQGLQTRQDVPTVSGGIWCGHVSLHIATLYVDSCYLNANGYGYSGVSGVLSYGDYLYVTNCKVNGFYRGWRTHSAGGTYAGRVCENTTFYSSAQPIVTNCAATTFRNCYWDNQINAPCNVIAYACASAGQIPETIGGGTGNLSGIVPADEFESLDSTSPDFLTLPIQDKYAAASRNPDSGTAPLTVKFNAKVNYDSTTSRLAQAGIAPVYAGSTDIAGEPRPGEDGKYAIGCHEPMYRCVLSKAG